MSTPRVRHATAPAKLNLGLRVVGRRADGYHELESVFVPLALGDDVEVAVVDEPTDTAEVTLALEGRASGVPRGPANLAAQAARRFLEESDLRVALRIRLYKELPPAAGLGGGSSDAGAVLGALSGLFPAALSEERRRALALALGADVPYFLDPRPARVTGIGERIDPLDGVPSLAVLVANPGRPLSTADVFRAFDAEGRALTQRGAVSRMPPLGCRLDAGDPGAAAALVRLLENDLEPVSTRLCRVIGDLRQGLLDVGALAVGMSGSGPTVFGVFADPAAARDALSRLRTPPGAWVRATRTQPSPGPGRTASAARTRTGAASARSSTSAGGTEWDDGGRFG